MENENNINFLLQAALKIPLKDHTGKLLKAYYRAIARKIAGPNSVLSEILTCKKCSLFWCEGDFTIQFQRRRVRSSKGRKLVKKLESGIKLTRKQKIRAKWFRKRITNSMVVICNICKHKTKVPFRKPKCKTDVVEPTEDVVRKPKRKKSDKIAGLKIDQKCFATKPMNTTAQKIKESNLSISNKSMNITKCKNKNNQKSKGLKSISETQRKNKILELANVLKKVKKIESSNSNDRLKNLLR